LGTRRIVTGFPILPRKKRRHLLAASLHENWDRLQVSLRHRQTKNRSLKVENSGRSARIRELLAPCLRLGKPESSN
jgi:hypothetical protein